MKPESLDPLITGVFAFIDSLPREVITRGQCRLFLSYRGKPGGLERAQIADFIKKTYRLQWPGCPLRPVLAAYRLYFQDDMADALAAAYLLHKDGKAVKEAFLQDYTPGFMGILRKCDIGEYRKAGIGTSKYERWTHFASFYEEGDWLVGYNHGGSVGYLLCRGDRLVWEEETAHLSGVACSLRRNNDMDHFIAIGNTKGFLNGDFTWPPADWVNPVTDEEEKAYAEENTIKMFMERNWAVREAIELPEAPGV